MSLYVGAISGTSVDGLDLALLEIDSSPTIVDCTTVDFPERLQEDLRSLASPGSNEIFRMGQAHVGLGRFIGNAVTSYLSRLGVNKKQVAAIGSHGQTIRHHPDENPPFSIQIGDGSTIAELTGITTVCDFRSRDLAAGGVGAPLVPLFHQALFGARNLPTVVLNVGGIANISVLGIGPHSMLKGYDTGPGNALLDAWIQYHLQLPYDADGAWSRTGTVNEHLLEQMLSHPYFAKNPPKSTGKELFSLEFIHSQLKNHSDMDSADVQATLHELTCQSIAREIAPLQVDSVIVCGGGRLNLHLVARLQELLRETNVLVAEDVGVDGDGIEAATFAYLAWCLLEGKAGNVPEVTAASGSRLLGSIFPGDEVFWRG